MYVQYGTYTHTRVGAGGTWDTEKLRVGSGRRGGAEVGCSTMVGEGSHEGFLSNSGLEGLLLLQLLLRLPSSRGGVAASGREAALHFSSSLSAGRRGLLGGSRTRLLSPVSPPPPPLS